MRRTPRGADAGTRTTPELLPRHRVGSPLPERILVLRALHLGDMLCAVPALRALRAALPTAEITLLGLPWARSFVSRFEAYLDRFLEFPGFPGFPERPVAVGEVARFLAEAQRMRFDLALQMHGSGRYSNPICFLVGARRTAGYVLPGDWCPDPDRFMPYPAGLPEIRRHLRLMSFLGVPLGGEELEFPIQPDDRAGLDALRAEHSLAPHGYVCLHPGARAPERRWPPRLFAKLGDRLADLGLQVVVTGTAAERDLAAAVIQAMTAPAADVAGRTSLGTLAALVHDARLVVCGDTGVSHVAAALQVPSVVLFTASEVRRWAPLDRRLHRPVRAVGGGGQEAAWLEARDLLGLRAAHVA
ncbi:MAG: glycosyltransferase family 9 protein [Chloroflexota bacterium]|nr:glycosyltransferase family 9 protein [Chloroflexota bacterium]